MRKKLIIKLGILGLAAIFLLSMASYSTDKEVTTKGKPDKPFKPGEPGKERIAFYEDLVGDQVVEGCCPNAGPFPAYNMTLKFGSSKFSEGFYEGWLFINYYGAGRNRKYKVQFWWDYENDLGIEIIGGVIDQDKKTKVLTVTFTNEECRHIKSDEFIKLVNFTLVRHESD